MEVLDLEELANYFDSVSELFPKETKRFLKVQGNKLKKRVVGKVESRVNRVTGELIRSIKAGKVYKYDGSDSIRVYSSSPHAHLKEYGHRIVDVNGVEHGFKKGEHFFEDASNEYENEFIKDLEDFIDEVLESR